MIIEKLQDTDKLTGTEKILAEYILTHADDVAEKNIRELAEVTHVSPSTVSRLCQKIGVSSYNSFKVQFSTECTEVYQKMRQVDENFPFTEADQPMNIVDKLSKLSVHHILDAKDNMDYATMTKVVRAICARRFVDIYGLGLSLTGAYGFAEKMSRIGFFTTIVQDTGKQIYRAKISSKDQFAILISHSGKSQKTLEAIKILHRRKVPALLITGNRISPMIQYATYVCYIYSAEKLTMQDKLDSFGAQMALHFLLDCLYSLVFANKYAEHMAISQELTNGQFDP